MVALRLWLPLPLIGEMAIHTCAVVDGPAVDGRPDAVVVVAEVLARRLDAEVEAPMTDRLTLDPAVAMTTHQLPVVGRRLIRTRVLCMYHRHIIISSGVTTGWLLRLVTGAPLVVGTPRQF